MDRYRVADDVVYEVLDGEAVVLNLATGRYYRLNGTASRMWQLIDERRGLDEVAAVVADEFDAHPDAIESDLVGLVSRLKDNGLVVAAAAPEQSERSEP